MINKQNHLGKEPPELGMKDAVHVAIVAVRAGATLSPGEKVRLNERREAVPSSPDGVGIVDPFRRSKAYIGDTVWLLVNSSEVPNVQHVWDHPYVDFSPPEEDPQYPKYLKEYADTLGLTFLQLIRALTRVADTECPVDYEGTLSPDELQVVLESMDTTDLWYGFQEHADYPFYNVGTSCCPEYSLPDCELFSV